MVANTGLAFDVFTKMLAGQGGGGVYGYGRIPRITSQYCRRGGGMVAGSRGLV